MPQATILHGSDLLGLVVIMAGLIMFRFFVVPESDHVLPDEPTEEPSQEISEQPVEVWPENTQESLREPLIMTGDV